MRRGVNYYEGRAMLLKIAHYLAERARSQRQNRRRVDLARLALAAPFGGWFLLVWVNDGCGHPLTQRLHGKALAQGGFPHATLLRDHSDDIHGNRPRAPMTLQLYRNMALRRYGHDVILPYGDINK